MRTDAQPTSGASRSAVPDRALRISGLLTLLLALIIALAGLWLYRAGKRHLRMEAEKNLESIAQLKLHQIADWRSERIADASVLMESPFMREALRNYLADPTSEAEQIIRNRLRSLIRHYGYDDISVTDPEGRVRISVAGRIQRLHDKVHDALPHAAVAGRPLLTGLHAGSNGIPPHLGIVAPMLDKGETGKPLAFLILHSDARKFLYSDITSWPTATKTAETLLVRRDGDHVLFLNDLRHRKNTALDLRVPLEQSELPACAAALGIEGAVQGPDYRGVPVLAVVHPVPDSPWFMVAKIDRSEALAGKQAAAIHIGIVVITLLGLLGCGYIAVRQRQMKALYQEQWRREQARRKAEEGYRITLRGIGDGVIAADTQDRVELMNPVAEELTGWNADEAAGQPMESVFHIVNQHTRRTVESPVEKVIREGTVVGLANHTMLIARDGTERPIADSGAPVKDDDGQLVGVVLVFRDQTATHAADEERQAMEAQLRQAQKLESIGTLAGGVAHEINNPINGIMNYAQLIHDQAAEDSTTAEFAEQIIAETERVADLVRNLLSFARQDKKSHSPARIADIIEHTLSLTRTVLRHDRVTLTTDIPDELPAVTCRSQQIQQVLMNLVTNARDALNEKYPAYDKDKIIRITVQKLDREEGASTGEAPPHQWIRLTVEDHGTGMPDELSERIFDPFFTTKPRERGTGLGLSISHGIIADHGGRLTVESEPGAWTRFHVDLPLDNTKPQSEST